MPHGLQIRAPRFDSGRGLQSPPTRLLSAAQHNGARAGLLLSAGLLVRRLLVLDSVHLAVLAFAAMPPHGELAAPAAHDGEIDREHEKPKRDHPKAEHGEEADETANHEQNAEPDADRLRLRQVPVALKMRTLGAIGFWPWWRVRPDIRAMPVCRNPPRRRARRHVRGIGAKLWKGPLPFAIYQVVAPLDLSALCSPVAQLVEQAAVNRWVAGSSPARGAK